MSSSAGAGIRRIGRQSFMIVTWNSWRRTASERKNGMPHKLKHACGFPGCPNLADERYCAEHAKTEGKRYERERGSAAARGYDSRWRKYRLMFLAEHPLCAECERQGIVTAASDVDHIQPVNGPGDPLFWESSNHQALCHECHSKKTAKENGGFGNAVVERAKVFLVCGPPGSGKTTYVEQHKQPGDLIWDYDKILSALTDLPMYERPEGTIDIILALREALFKQLEKPGRIKRAWIIMAAPKRAQREEIKRRLNAEIVMLNVPAEECIRRISSRHDPEGWIKAIRYWWGVYEPD